LGLLGTGAVLVGIVTILLVTPVGSAFMTNGTSHAGLPSASPALSLKYRSVSDSGDCDDYGLGNPCANCELIGSMTTSMGKTVDAVCTDVLTAVGANQAWHAYYYVSSRLGSGAININETSGTLHAGQSLQFFFGIENGCAVGYNPEIVKIVGPHNSVEIGYSGCG
ncbi:MAG: hypothetical protein ACREEC_13970, partial [Thermoplasmata archaeon]